MLKVTWAGSPREPPGPGGLAVHLCPCCGAACPRFYVVWVRAACKEEGEHKGAGGMENPAPNAHQHHPHGAPERQGGQAHV